jgi:bifunctional UDP-N-acetylglucosamine pyrophosphorylase / glucosamine-1-phosphate N-acetyltransferase
MAAPAPASRPTVLIMAAGHGTRMRSSVPNLLHPICGRPMIQWVIDAARGAGAARIVCVARPGSGLEEALPGDADLAEQRTGEGTAAAVLAAREAIEACADDAPALILSGDHPLIDAELLRGLLGAHADAAAAATLLTTDKLDPAGYGRVVRGADGGVERLVETKHAEGVPAEQLAIREINLGTYVFRARELIEALDRVPETGGERYLTGVFPLLRERGLRVATHATDDTRIALGVNTRADLIDVERHVRARLVERHALAGVSFAAPETVVIDAVVAIGEDTHIAQGVTLAGATRIGAGCTVGPHTTLRAATLGDDVSVPYSHLVECEVARGATIGPFAYLRPGARVEEEAKVGSFVEVKNSTIGRGAKVPHLSYIGDADIGENTNVGAGNITANYDGRRKHRTHIGRNVRTGVDTAFVAPVSVGDGAYTGAGSVIVEDVPDGALGISRSPQRNVEGYAERASEEGNKE